MSIINNGSKPMPKTKRQREAESLRTQRSKALAVLDGKVICNQCGARLETMDIKCSAEIDALCDGFVAIELALYPDGRSLPLVPEEQIKRCLEVIATEASE